MAYRVEPYLKYGPMLIHKQLEMHGHVTSTLVTTAAISIYNTDCIYFIEPVWYKMLYSQWTQIAT